MLRVYVNREAAEAIKRGDPRVYARNVVRGGAEKGEWVEVWHENEFLGCGFANPESGYYVKVFTRERREFGIDIIEDGLERARRRRWMYDRVYRWVFGEADGIPGLILDRYNDLGVIRVNVAGLDRYVEEIAKVTGLKRVYEKSKGKGRKREGLGEREGWVKGGGEREVIKEGKVKFLVDVRGQKTGFYLDQRENRLFFSRVFVGDVLDLFSYSGGFGMHAAVEGARVTFVDRSPFALSLLRENLELNGVEGEVVRADVRDFLRGERRVWDTVVLDPPGLAKGERDKKRALRTYFLLNRLAIKRTRHLLVTCSCSQAVGRGEFMRVVAEAARKEGGEVRFVWEGRQAPDHPSHPAIPETSYLKCLFAYVE